MVSTQNNIPLYFFSISRLEVKAKQLIVVTFIN